jgi:hypothetical protein
MVVHLGVAPVSPGLVRGLSELQNRKSGDELYLQAESEVMDEQPNTKELEEEIERINDQVRINKEVPDGTDSLEIPRV